MTRHELRVLYLLHRAGGAANHSEITHGMQRVKRQDRERALASVELLELVSSAQLPASKGKGGRGGLRYWLTDGGKEAVADLLMSGDLRDPAAEKRGTRHGRSA